MKTLLKILTPAISTLGIATISLASCGTQSSDGLVAIPTQYLNIEGTTLDGLKPGDEGEGKDLAKLGYSKLTIPKSIKTASVTAMEAPEGIGYKAITKIDYEEGCECTTIGYITALSNLTTIVLPPKITNISDNAIIIPGGGKFNTLDISNVEDITCLTTKQWFNSNMEESKGTLIIKSSQKDKVTAIKTNNPRLEDFEVKEK